jgi:hypothetical protein
MIDVLYTLGPDSGHNNQELRWSLRGLEKFGRNVGRVIVAGFPPDWLSDEVVKFPVAKPEGKEKDSIIWHNVMSAIESGVVSGRFLLSSDDHFITAPFDFDQTPLWRRTNKGNPADIQDRCDTAYWRVMAQTREVLLANGYGIAKTYPHRNTVIDCRCVEEAKRLLSTAKNQSVGLEINCVMGNLKHKMFGEPFVLMKDWKVSSFNRSAVDSGFFSIRDSAFNDPAFTTFMNAAFGTPSKYEKV